MPHALITGSPAHTSDVAAALRCGGFESLCADTAAELTEVCTSIPPKSLDCYVQLPDDHTVRTTALTAAPAVVADGRLGRYEAIATVAPLLTEAATVVLVIGDRAVDEPPPELADAVDGLTRFLASTRRHDHPATVILVALAYDRHWPSEIASIARSGHGRSAPGPGGSPVSSGDASRGVLPDGVSSYADLEPDLGFAEWRLEVLGLLETT